MATVESKASTCQAAGHEDCTRSSRLLFALTSVQGLLCQDPLCREVHDMSLTAKNPTCQHVLDPCELLQ